MKHKATKTLVTIWHNKTQRKWLDLQLPDVSQTLGNPGPPDTKVPNTVDEGGKARISLFFSTQSNDLEKINNSLSDPIPEFLYSPNEWSSRHKTFKLKTKGGGKKEPQFSTYFKTWAAIKYIWALYKFGKIPQIITWVLGILPLVLHFNLCPREQFLTQGVEIYTPNQ